jgi:hypothetical protein
MTDLAFRTEYLAEFCDDAASVFRYEVIMAAIDPEIRSGPIDGHRYTIGFDPARYADRSGVCVLDITSEPFIAVEVLDIGRRSYLEQAAQIGRLAERYHGAKVLVDATAHDQLVDQLKLNGVRATPFTFTNTSKGELIDGLVLALEQNKVKIPHHEALVRELTYYRFERTAAAT